MEVGCGATGTFCGESAQNQPILIIEYRIERQIETEAKSPAR